MSGFLDGVTRGLTAYTERQSRMEQFRALSAKSDDELTAMGLRRDQIARHVYRDIFFL